MSGVVELRHATTVEGLHQTLAESRRRILELEADSRRLDWLATLRAGASFWYEKRGWSFAKGRRQAIAGDTLRAAIDAAMRDNV